MQYREKARSLSWPLGIALFFMAAISCPLHAQGAKQKNGGSAAASAKQDASIQAIGRKFMRGLEPARSGTPAWFGLRLPGPATDPDTGAFATVDTDFPARPATFRPGPMDPLLDGGAIRAELATIVGFSHESKDRGDYLWGRVAGRPTYDETTAWTADQLKAGGLEDAHLEAFQATDISLPISGEVRLIGSDAMGVGSKDIVLHSAMVGGTGPVNGTVTAALIYVGQGVEADLAGRDLKGKIAVIVSTPDPSLYSALPSRRIGAVMNAGAIGVIEILVQAGNLKSFDRDRHGCGKDLCFTIGGEDGFFLQHLLGRAAKSGKIVTASLSARSESVDHKIANVVASIPGKTDRTVIIDAHADGWFGGADDNGSGLAVMIALARHFAKQPKLERTLVFVASAGHHSAGSNGVAAFRATHNKDYVANADLILNIEHVAQSDMMRSYIDRQSDNFGSKIVAATGDIPKQVAVSNRAPFLIDLWRQGVECFGLDVQRIVDEALPGDVHGYADLDEVPRTQMIASGGVYHTSGDDLYSVPPDGLERAARFYAYFVQQVANAPAAQLRGNNSKKQKTCPATP